ncbi:MAG: helix-turn-helix domain-containing protein [Opitutaceae bacterium]|jgi:putative transcriptional regulator|nr:helix-turn-helix domain-containing protein [Opitutaceae bacterium]
MNTRQLKAMIREKEALETGRVAPAGVTEVKFDARGRPVVIERDARAWQRAQAAAHAEKVATARRRLRLTQDEFSTLLGVSRRTLENWEQGRRSPTGAARVLIQVAAAHPKTVLEAVA